MKHKRKTASAKSLVFDPLFRPRQEKTKKGKGSYSRRPRHPQPDSGPSTMWGIATSAGLARGTGSGVASAA